ncbi:MAG TPA: hypothetical protein VFU15_04240 [Bacteroidia bacterium]|nr:hypothetical protein [Bacteroidia bacterium]
MRKAPLAFLLLLPLFLFGSDPKDKGFLRASEGLSTNIATTRKFSVPPASPGKEIIALETPFASADFLEPQLAAMAKGKVIEKIQLVYTTYRESPSFDQHGLNYRRLVNLRKILPDAFTNPLTEWELVPQTGASSPEVGRTYFHGFVIYFRPASSPGLIKDELHMLDSLFNPAALTGGSSPRDSSGSPHVEYPPSDTAGLKTITLPDGSTVVRDHDIPEDSLRFFLKPSCETCAIVNAKYADSTHKNIIAWEQHGDHRMKRTWKLEEHRGVPTYYTGFADVNLHDPDSVITSTFRRNKWKNMIVVCDITGSMSPYTAQLFSWIPGAVAQGDCAGFVFFNDGDRKSNSQKVVGKTGGIYSTNVMRFDSIYALARKAMQGGDGGDTPENNIEALIYAINKMNPQGDIVLIADNFASPRDLELVDKVNRPVHVILCGARASVNPDYLFIARVTGGSVHTVTQDITNLSQMQEGEEVEIGRQHFLLHDDHFIPIENFSHVNGY